MGAPGCSGERCVFALGSVHTESSGEKTNSKGNVFFSQGKKKKRAGWISLLTGKNTVLGKLDPVKALLGTSNRYFG